VTDPRRGAAGKLLVLLVLIVAAWFAARAFGLFDAFEPARLAEQVRSARAVSWAPAVFVLVYIGVTTLGLPATPLTLAGGALFGPWWGTAANWLAATLGATGAYLLARLLGRDAVRSLLGARVEALDRFAGASAFSTLLRLRLLPLVPFNALNFGAGFAGVRPVPYVAATALGILPGTAVYTYFADALLAGVDGAQESAFLRVAIAGTLLVLLSFAPTVARRAGWITALVLAWKTGPLDPPLLTAQGAPAANVLVVNHAPFDALLRAHVTADGLVEYDAFARAPSFARYLGALAEANPAAWSRADQLAYWINVYNAYTIHLINSRGERRSIRNINKRFGISLKSPWAEPVVRAAGRTLSLDDVEHRIIRPTYGDARIHVALVCAARGCPPLRTEAYNGARLDAQLDDQARRFLGTPEKNRIDVVNGVVYGSPIFTWYRGDFGGTLAGVGAFWARYVNDDAARTMLTRGEFRWVDTPYDWSLNAVRR
jgi:uncharacterized membrane protein YdjX (TVP38/TMEM64 family)